MHSALVGLGSFLLLMAPAFGQALSSTATPTLTAADVTVGYHLQTGAKISISEPVMQELKITITSNDPKRLLFSLDPHQAGSQSVVATIQPGRRETPDIYLYGLGHTGTATYSAKAQGYADAKGTATLAPSGFVISGPYGVGKAFFRTTTGAGKSDISIYPALLDSSLKYVRSQQLAGGVSVKVELNNATPNLGKLMESSVTLENGATRATTAFKPSSAGEAVIALVTPKEFKTPTENTTVKALVANPGLAMTGDVTVGYNLSLGGTIGLGEPAPAAGATITLTSKHPNLLLLGDSEGHVAPSIQLKIPAGGIIASYALIGAAKSGKATYTATAPGYVSTEAPVTIAESGVVLSGPTSFPHSGGPRVPGFVANAGSQGKLHIYSVYLDPVTHRAADVTVQGLRPGVSMTVEITSDNPEVATVDSPVTLKAGMDTVETRFTSKKEGTAMLKISTPEGYSTPANATVLRAIVVPASSDSAPAPASSQPVQPVNKP